MYITKRKKKKQIPKCPKILQHEKSVPKGLNISKSHVSPWRPIYDQTPIYYSLEDGKEKWLRA